MFVVHLLIVFSFLREFPIKRENMYVYVHDKSKQGKYIHPEQLSLFSKKKLPWVGFEPTTLRVLGERYMYMHVHIMLSNIAHVCLNHCTSCIIAFRYSV